jgi:transposase InsO family protein
LSDLTEHPTREGKLYLCAIKDVWSNRIVGYSIAGRMESAIAVAALDRAVARRAATGQPVAGCVLHTDRGSQFRAPKLQQGLVSHRVLGSMGQVGSAGDNAAMESFFALLQKNVLDRQAWDTRDQLRIAIVSWIERTYHHRRRQFALARDPRRVRTHHRPPRQRRPNGCFARRSWDGGSQVSLAVITACRWRGVDDRPSGRERARSRRLGQRPAGRRWRARPPTTWTHAAA